MTVKCGDCRLWRSDQWNNEDDPDEYDIGECTAMDGVVLPYTWRWARREVVSGCRGEAIECARFERKD